MTEMQPTKNADKQEFSYSLLLIPNDAEPQGYNDPETLGTHFDKK